MYENENIQKQIDLIKKTKKTICSSKEKAMEFLYSTGIYTKTGKLKKIYQ